MFSVQHFYTIAKLRTSRTLTKSRGLVEVTPPQAPYQRVNDCARVTGYSSTIRLGKKPTIRPESVLWTHASFPCRLDQESRTVAATFKAACHSIGPKETCARAWVASIPARSSRRTNTGNRCGSRHKSRRRRFYRG